MNSSSKGAKVLPSTPYTPNSYKVMTNAANVAQDRRPKSIFDSLHDRSVSSANKRSLMKQRSISTRNLVIAEEGSMQMSVHKATPLSSTSSFSGVYKSHICSKNCEKKYENRLDLLEKRVQQMESELAAVQALNQHWEDRYNALNERFETDIKILRETLKKPTKKPETSDSFKLRNWISFGNWFRQRPTRESLREKNIYNDEPCFDTEIEMVLKHEVHKSVPKILVDCCDIIEDKLRKSNEPIEGIYRQSGDHNKIQSLRFQIDNNNYNALQKPDIDIHTITGVLKLFLREIKSPLISNNEARTFIGPNQQWAISDLSRKIEKLICLICSLPEVNRSTLEYLFGHFHRLTKIPQQKINSATLAISVAPSIFHTVLKGAAHTDDIHEILKDNETLSNCLELMIDFHSKIFTSYDGTTFLSTFNMNDFRRPGLQPDLYV